MAFFITDGILDFLLNQRLLDMTHYIKSFIAATLLSLLFPLTMMAQETITDLGTFPTWNKRPATMHNARITKNTRLIMTKDYATLNPVYDGVFSVEENGLLSFYLANGAKRITNTLLRSIWQFRDDTVKGQEGQLLPLRDSPPQRNYEGTVSGMDKCHELRRRTGAYRNERPSVHGAFLLHR